MILWQFVALLAAHWLGDFVLQSHSMGINKSKRNDVLALHVIIYMAVITFSAWLIGLHAPTLFAAANGMLHFATDYVTSRMTSRLWAAGRPHDFFVVIGFDQLLHQVSLAVTLWGMQ